MRDHCDDWLDRGYNQRSPRSVSNRGVPRIVPRKSLVAMLSVGALASLAAWPISHLRPWGWVHTRVSDKTIFGVLFKHGTLSAWWWDPVAPDSATIPSKGLRWAGFTFGQWNAFSEDTGLHSYFVTFFFINLWPAILILAAYPSLCFYCGPIRRRRRRRRGLCTKCGYNLTRNTTGVCPECGSVALRKYRSMGDQG
jgi:hypothetical protein